MKTDYDPKKDAANFLKHKVSLRRAEEMDWGAALVIPDLRVDYGEDRYIGYAPIDDCLYVAIFTMRGDTMRVIGLRRANKRERKKYETYLST
jgi:uncharacterized DUF497 family protein